MRARCTCRARRDTCRAPRSAHWSRRCARCCTASGSRRARTRSAARAGAAGAPTRRVRTRGRGQANPARELARQIGRTIPLIYGGGAIGAVAAYRWKCDVNENAKAPAFWHTYPELDHNEICAWGQHGDVTRQLITLVELRHGFEHPRLRLRFDATREIIDECVHQVLSVEAQGEGPARAAARPHVRRRLDELLPRAAERRRPRPDRRDLRAQGAARAT